MTQRERFIRLMTFQSVDRLPLMEMGVWPETLRRWHGEGLPETVTNLRQLEEHLGLDISFNLNWLPIDQEFLPAFEEKVLEDHGTDEVVQDNRGTILRRRKEFASIPHYIRFPVETEADYEKLLPRLNGADPARYPADFDEDLRRRRERGEIIGLNFRAFFGFPRILMGLENLSVAFYDQPALVKRIIRDRLRFARDLLARVLGPSDPESSGRTGSGAVDFVQVWEDMAFKTAPLVSPKLVREFMAPAYAELTAMLRGAGVKVIMVDCDGHVNDLLPIYLETGMDGVHPCEIAAGADPNELRRIAPKAALMGGMDKRAIASGKAGVEAELRRVAPLLSQGAFIPFLDHFVPPDVSYDLYRYYVERRREMLAIGN